MIAHAPNSEEALVQAILAAGGEHVKGSWYRCWHGEKSPSLHIRECQDGRHRAKCFGCDFSGDEHDINAMRTGRTLKDTLAMDDRATCVKTDSKPATPAKAGKSTAQKDNTRYTREQIKAKLDKVGTNRTTYYYKNILGLLVGIVIRFLLAEGEKTFRQLTPAGDGNYYYHGPDELWPLYRIRDIQPGSVVLAEGELCADLLRDMGINATTWAGGCKAYKNTDWAFLSGRHVIVWPDFDKNGRDAAEAIREILLVLGCTVEIIDIDSLGFTEKGSDIKEYLAAGNSADDVRQLIAQYERPTASQRSQRRSERLLNGELKAAPLPFPILGHTTKLMLPGSADVLAGLGGAGKSFWLMQVIRYLIQSGIEVSVLMLESGKDYHIERAVAQEACEPGWLDDDWRSDPSNMDRIWAIENDHGGLMKRLDSVIHDTPPFTATYEYAIDWLTKRGQEDCRVAIIDPVTMIDYDDSREIPTGSKRLVKAAISAAQKYEMTVILVNHYQKANNEIMQGGSSFQDHTDVVLQFSSLPEIKEMEVLVPGYDNYHESAQVNRIIQVKKARRGKLCWHRIGYYWDKQSLTYAEKGILTKE